MEIGVTLRNMGPQSSAEIMQRGVTAAEQLGFESLWITDHIAIPPDDAEGSGGRYLDPLTTLGWLAGLSRQIRLGTGVLILPYRPALPTAKQIASVQELSGNRLLLGVGVGWMDAEFKALGVDRHRRGVESDAVLEFINACFADDTVTANGQAFLFKPRPPKPPILVGGRAPHALRRAVAYGSGWLPMARNAAQISDDAATYRQMCVQAGCDHSITVMTGLDPAKPQQARDHIDSFRQLGVQRLVTSIAYNSATEYEDRLASLRHIIDAT